MTHARWLVVALALGCDSIEPVIVLDVDKNCNEVRVKTVLREAGLGAVELLDAAMDPRATGPWLLVRTDSDPAAPLSLWHVVDGYVDRYATIDPPAAPGSWSLRPAPTPDEVWVMHRGPGAFRLWRIDAISNPVFVQSSGELATFPRRPDHCSPCDTSEWYRDLVFLEQRPHVVSVPPSAPTHAVAIYVGDIATGSFTIGVGTENTLNFQRMCPPLPSEIETEICELGMAMVSYPEITVLGRQTDPRPRTSRLLVHRERAEDGVPDTFPDIFVVSLGLDGDNVPAGILRSFQDGARATPGPPHGIAVDGFASYSLYTSQHEGVKLLRLPSPPGELDFENLTYDVGPLDFDSTILQLDADIALGRIVDGAWEITKLFPDALAQSRVTLYEADAPIASVRGIGASTFLLRKDDARADIVQLRCVRKPLP